jgi:hypothetical protein
MITENSLRILLEGKPALQRDILLKAKPFLQKYNIKFDLSNYQNDGYLKAGGYKFWFDSEEGDFRTNEPKYAGKGFADIRELLAYALDIKEAEKEHRNYWGLQTYLKRSKPNKGYSNNLYKKVVSESYVDNYYRHQKELENGTGRIDRNGDYFKKEVTKKDLKRRKRNERSSDLMNDMVSMHFARVVNPVISAVNRLYAGKDNVAKIELEHDKTWDAKPDSIGSGKWIDPLYVSFAVIDTNGKRWESKVDARTSLGGYSPRGDFKSDTNISPETLHKIEEGIYKLVHAKLRAFHANSRKNGSSHGGEGENIRRHTIGEEAIAEGYRGKFTPAINYKSVHNYLIKARKAVKEGDLSNAEKFAWNAKECMHEDEMQHCAYKNAYNVMKKELSNIESAIIKLRMKNKENN